MIPVATKSKLAIGAAATGTVFPCLLGSILSKTYCSEAAIPTVVTEGVKVAVHYTGKLYDSGEQFDSSEGRDPLEFEVGAGQMIPGFDAAVHGMKLGEKKTVELPAEMAYGERREEMMGKVPVDKLPEGTEVGTKLRVQGGQTVTVVSIDGDEATLDANHELAGKVLVFDIEIISIKVCACVIFCRLVS